MGQETAVRTDTHKRNWGDPRLYQIASLSVLLAYGLVWLDFDLSLRQVLLTIASALVTQYAASRWGGLAAFDPKSALISSLSLCLLLRTDYPAVPALAAVLAIASKFVLRWRDKHLFNPTNLALASMLASGLGWISPAQWGQAVWLGFLIANLGSLVVTRAARADVTLSFLGFYVGGLVGRALWLGDPLAIPLHQIETGSLLLFAFFMISDPKTTPDARKGRVAYALCVALMALYVQYGLFRPHGPLWALITCAPLVPLIDCVWPGPRYRWTASPPHQSPAVNPVLVPLSIHPQRRFS